MHTDNATHKKAFVYRLCPTKAQEAALVRILDLTRELYNAALQERRDAWRKARKPVTLQEMRLLRAVKAVRPHGTSQIYPAWSRHQRGLCSFSRKSPC